MVLSFQLGLSTMVFFIFWFYNTGTIQQQNGKKSKILKAWSNPQVIQPNPCCQKREVKIIMTGSHITVKVTSGQAEAWWHKTDGLNYQRDSTWAEI